MSILNQCSWTTVEKDKHLDRINGVINLWNQSNGIQDIHGTASIADNQFTGSYKSIDNLLKSRVDEKLNFHPDFVLRDKVMDRLELEVKSYNKKILTTGYKGVLSNIVGTPHEMVKRSPLSWSAYNEIDQQVNYERTNLAHLREFTVQSSSHLLQAFKNAADRGEMKDDGKKVLRQLLKLEGKISTSESGADRASYELAIRKLLGLDKTMNPTEGDAAEGKILRLFREGIETPDAQWKELAKEYDPALASAVDASKAYFGRMSGVLLSGLGKLEQNYLLRKHGDSSRKSAVVQSDKKTMDFLTNLDRTRNAIRAKVDEGSYFPHYILKDLPQLKLAVDKMQNLNDRKAFGQAATDAENILLDMQASLSHRAKGRNDMLEYSFYHDPIMVGQMYGYDVIGFNKQNQLQNTMIKFTRGLPQNPKVSAEFVNGMNEYLQDIYTISSKGYKDRPDWVNNWIHLLGSATVVRTMGLGFTGSIRNLASVATYVSYFGLKTLRNASKAYETQTGTSKSGIEGIGSITRRAEQENGFLFAEGGIDLANELFTFGLLPEKGVNEKTIQFDEYTGKIQYETNDGVLKYLKPAADWTVYKSLKFHRITENWMRKWMFRTAFISKYQADSNQREYAESRGKQRLERDASNFAINAVNSWAYEYAAHAKSKFIRGVPGELDANGNLINEGKVYMGAASQSMNMLMHYPHSLIASHIRILRGAGKSIQVGDWQSQEMIYIRNYAGIYGAIQLSSALLNLELDNIAENDTIEKIKEIVASITQYDKSGEITRGVVGGNIGPLADDVRYVMEMLGMKNADRSDWEQILMGNMNYAEQYGNEADKAFWYKVGTTAGMMQSKVLPSFQDGRGWDVVRHLFRMYPSKTTKKWHKGLKKMVGMSTSKRDINKELLSLAEQAEEYGNRWSTGYPGVKAQ